MNIKYSEFFRNLKSLPPEGSSSFYDLVDWEVEKCLGGVNVGGVHIPGFLYWHLNHWWIGIDQLDNYGNSIIVASLPDLRDTEWERVEAIMDCIRTKDGYIEIGARRQGKSEMLASYLMYNATLFENTQNAIITGNSNDQGVIVQKIDFGHKKIWDGLRVDKLDRSWKGNQVRLGYKDISNEDHVWSVVAIRNADEGTNTEVAAGLTLKTFILDEIGKYPFGEVVSAAKPTLLTPNGWRGTPLLLGTGGDFKNGADAERYFMYPEANNFKGFTENGKTTGKFMSGLYRMDCKYDSNLFEYLSSRGQVFNKAQEMELKKIKMKVSDKEKALEQILKYRENKSKDPNRTEYLKEVMYFPLEVEECFLTEGENFFDEMLAAEQQKILYETGKHKGDNCILKESKDFGVECIIKNNDNFIAPISSFPLNPSESKEGCIVIYEHPVKDAPFGLYTCGVDPYKQDKSQNSDSLGAVYIYKRMHKLDSEKYQDMIVAHYVGRPDSIDTWCENARLLIKYYNALTMAENEDIYFIKYMQAKHEDYYLADQQPWLMSLVPTSRVDRIKGFHAASKIISYLNTQLKLHMEEELAVLREDDNIRKIYGVSRILDPMLLEEVKKFRPGGNYDRIRAASAAIALARNLDPFYSIESEVPEVETADARRKRKINYKKRMSLGASRRGL